MRSFNFHTRRVILIFLFIAIAYFIVVVFFRTSEFDRKITLDNIVEVIKNQKNAKTCKHPDLPIDAPEIMKFVSETSPIYCDAIEPEWVKVEGKYCIITDLTRKKYGDIKCKFTDLLRSGDHLIREGKSVTTDNQYLLVDSDLVRVECTSSYGKTWKSVLLGQRYDENLLKRTGWSYLPNNAVRMNVLMFGFDSLSRNTFIRKLPKTYEYLKNTLGTIVLEGYNIVGDGTPQALIPILTGQTELELPETRKRMPNAHYVNEYPFIWNDFSKAGYVTAFLEDLPSTGIFTYRLKGFNEPPTDHYMRPYYLAAAKLISKSPKYCAGSVPLHMVMLNFIKQFFHSYEDRPKFLFGFHGELSHNTYNMIGSVDADMVEWLKSLKTSNILNNTLLILMADHGHRFAEIRNTVQGKQEERLPFFSFTLPTWFQKKYPEAYANLKSNVDKLTTPFDIYSTLKHLLNWEPVTVADIKERSLSLFNKIPQKRACADAFIEPHWCACLDWHDIPIDTPIRKQLANAFVNTLNNLTATHRHLCDTLSLSNIIWVTKLAPNDNLLRFQKNLDYDGFVADLTANTQVNSEFYQVKIETVPGHGLFEAGILHFLKDNRITIKETDISRINMYGKQAKCVEIDFPHLRKYCHCKE